MGAETQFSMPMGSKQRRTLHCSYVQLYPVPHLDPHLDPHREKQLAPDPHKLNADLEPFKL